jgi:uncharacterized protein (TIGR02265 family)
VSDAPIVYRNTVDAVLERLLVKSKKLTPRLEQKLGALGIKRGETTDIPQSTWRQMLPLVASELFPNEPLEQGHRKLGAAVLGSFAETLVGKALFTTLRVIGVRRGLERMTKNFRVGNNFTDSRLTGGAENDVELWISDVNAVPEYIRGLMEAACSAAGGKEVSVEVVRFESPAATYRIRWT